MKRGLWVDFYYDFSDGYLLLGTMLPLHVQEKLATNFVTSKLNLAKSSPNRVLYFFSSHRKRYRMFGGKIS